MHIATATEKDHTVTMTKEDNNYLTGTLQKQHNGKMIRNHQISKEKAGFVTYSFLKSSLDMISLKVQISIGSQGLDILFIPGILANCYLSFLLPEIAANFCLD